MHDAFGYDYRFLRPAQAELIDSMALVEIYVAIDTFRYTCKQNNCKFGMIFHPMYMEYPSEVYLNAPVIEYCRKQNIPHADEYEFLSRRGMDKFTTDYYWPKDGHFNSRGYLLLAECALELFEKEQWLKSDSTTL